MQGRSRFLGTRQLLLSFGHADRMTRRDFIVGPSNRVAIDAIEHWPDWPSRTLVLVGPEASGKTHLANIFSTLSGARIHAMATADWHHLAADAAGSALVIDDAGPGVDEAGLFHLLNAVEAARGHLLIAARELPVRWGVTLPDLMSRLRAASPVQIGEPEDRLLEDVIAKLFVDRQIAVEPAVIRYMVQRMERSYAVASDLVDRLDCLAIERKAPVTKALVAELIGRGIGGDPTLPGFEPDF